MSFVLYWGILVGLLAAFWAWDEITARRRRSKP